MGFDDIPHLILGLGFPVATDYNPSDPPKKLNPKPKKFTKESAMAFEPSLTLGLSGDQTYDKLPDHENPGSSYRQESGGGSEEMEMEMEKVGSRIRNEEEDGKKKLRLTKAQSALLEKSFKHNSTLNPKQKKDLARELNLRPRQVEVWFQNRRARTKLKQTEIDCEYLKKCCETLTNENRRLHKELQELKNLNFAQPFYTQLSAATLTMCPSCEMTRNGDGGGGGAGTGENGSKNSALFTRVPKSHFNNHFANESAAC